MSAIQIYVGNYYLDTAGRVIKIISEDFGTLRKENEFPLRFFHSDDGNMYCERGWNIRSSSSRLPKLIQQVLVIPLPASNTSKMKIAVCTDDTNCGVIFSQIKNRNDVELEPYLAR